MLEVVRDGSEFSDKLSKYLDREMRVIKCWKHLAYVLCVPSDETRKFEMYSEHSPTEDLFVYLAEVWHPDLKVKELKQKLQKIHRNDLIESLNTGLFKDTMSVGDLISGETKFIKLLSPKLDIDSRTIGNWRSLASEFGIRKQQAEQFGLRGSGPSAELFRYIRSSVELCNLNMKELQEHFKAMERRDLVNLLKKEFDARTIEEKTLVRDELVDESPLLANIGERLNKDIRAIKNWRNLAYRLKIPAEIYKAFDSSKAEAKSPTKMMFEWLANWKPSLSVGDLLEGIRKIDRYDVVELVTKEAEIVFREKMERNSAKQLSDLEQMPSEKSNEKTLISNLENNAAIRGFIIRGNCGEGNCMFHALSRQLKIKKDIQISHGDLRGKIVEYLEDHRELPKAGDLFSFTYGYESWLKFLKDMAKDGTWGNHVVLVAAANKYEIPIRVVSSATDHQDIIVEPSSPFNQDIEPLVLGHVFEYHYVSLEQEFTSGRNCQTSSDNRLLSKHLEYGQPPFSATYQQHQQRYPQGPALNQPEDTCGSLRSFQSQSYYPSNRSFISSVLPGQVLCQKSQSKGELLSEKERIEIKVTELPVEVYRKICMKLSVKRNITFDDFRMVAEMLALDRDTMEFLGQQSNPAEVMFSQFGRNLMVFQLIKILHDIERFDVAAVLEEWVKIGKVK